MTSKRPTYAEQLAEIKRPDELCGLHGELARLKVSHGILADNFRALRLAWFNHVLRQDAHEREPESEEQEQRRTEQNKANREAFDRATGELLIGRKRLVSPAYMVAVFRRPESEGD